MSNVLAGWKLIAALNAPTCKCHDRTSALTEWTLMLPDRISHVLERPSVTVLQFARLQVIGILLAGFFVGVDQCNVGSVLTSTLIRLLGYIGWLIPSLRKPSPAVA